MNENVNVNALVSGLSGAQLKVGQLNVNALQLNPGFGYSASQDGGWFDIGGVSVGGTANFARNIYWEATTYLVGSPDPVLVVDSTGKIVALQNVSVTDQHGNPKGLGDTFAPGDTIEVGDLVNNGNGAANFTANSLQSLTDQLSGHPITPPPAGNIWGNDGLFIVQDTWNSVTIQNYSDRDLVTHEIEVIDRAGSTTINVTVDNIPGPTNSPGNDVSISEDPPNRVTFEFDIKHTIPPTIIKIENIQPNTVANSDVFLDGTIDNPIGTTEVRNDRGNILFARLVEGRAHEHRAARRSERLDRHRAGLHAAHAGRAAAGGQPVPGRSGTHERVFSLNAQAGVNIVLDITVVLREPPTTLDPQIGAIHAGNDIDIQVFDSLQGTDDGRGRQRSPSTCSRRRRPARSPAAACTTSHFRPDGPPESDLDRRPPRLRHGEHDDRERLHVHRRERGPRHLALPRHRSCATRTTRPRSRSPSSATSTRSSARTCSAGTTTT